VKADFRPHDRHSNTISVRLLRNLLAMLPVTDYMPPNKLVCVSEEPADMSDAHREELLLELDIPDGVPEAEQAVELIRAWVADGALVVTLNGEAFGDELQDWGRLLAEIGRHIARASSFTGDKTEIESLADIRKSFDATISATDAMVSGKVPGRVTH